MNSHRVGNRQAQRAAATRPVGGRRRQWPVPALTGLAVLVLLGSGLARAQTLPNAGSVLKQIQGAGQPPLPPKGAAVFEPPPPLKSIGGPTVTVKAFRFAGNHLLTSKRLARVVAGYVGRPLSFTQLQNAAIAVANAYRKAGWVVRAYLPQQDVTGGTVTIQVVEAVFGSVQVKGNPKRISAARLRGYVDAAQSPGKPVNADALDRALLLINDLPGVRATGSLAEGARQAETDLVLQAANRPLVTGNVTVNNAGERFTGAAQVSVAANLNSALGIGDLGNVMYLHSEGSDFESAGYDVPIGSRGLRVGVDASHLDYRIITAQFAPLDAHGRSTTGDLRASYPMVRTRLANLYVSFSAGDEWFDNESAGATTSNYSIENAKLGFTGNLFDNLGGGGANTASLFLEQGLVDLGDSPNEAADAKTVDTAGSFRKLTASLSRLQVLTERLSLYASATGQIANRNLDPSEMMYLGGPTGVRAYPTNEGGGSEGLLLTAEARATLPAGFRMSGFFDWGDVHFNKNNDFPGAPPQNVDVLKGAGVSLAWTASFGLTVQVTVAHRIGSNPVPTSLGTDQDGTLILNRVWAQATMPF